MYIVHPAHSLCLQLAEARAARDEATAAAKAGDAEVTRLNGEMARAEAARSQAKQVRPELCGSVYRSTVILDGVISRTGRGRGVRQLLTECCTVC